MSHAHISSSLEGLYMEWIETTLTLKKSVLVMAKKKTTVAKKKTTASSSSKCYRTPSPSPPPANAGMEGAFDFSSLSPRRKRKAAEEEVEDE